jgi:hypothetical protein
VENRSQKQIVLLYRQWAFFLLLFVLTASCAHNAENKLVIDESKLQEGDLIFRLGRGMSSQIVNLADKKGSYSHVGFLICDSCGWCVIHAVPDEASETGGKEMIKCEPVARFIERDRCESFTVMRHDSIEKIGQKMVLKAKEILQRQPLFDHNYLLSDSVELYCTELIYQIFMSAGIDLSEGRRHTFPLAKEPIIFPSDIIRNEAIREIEIKN